MAGTLTITEYNSYGDVSVSIVLEPATRVQHIAIGEVSDPLDRNTRIVALYADLPCRVQFIADGMEADADNAFPMKEEYEIQRLIHMGTGLRIAVFAAD